jgi:methyl-accepting chemotaxis protein
MDTVATTMAAAVEAQSSATQDIAGNAQSVMHSSERVMKAMHAVLIIADQSKTASQAVLQAVDDVGRTADTLQGEVHQFLRAIASGSESERRRYERIMGGGTRATLRVAGRAEADLAVQDVSRGGIALFCNWPLTAGTAATVVLPGRAGEAVARVVWSSNGVIALSFRQDEATLAKLDQTLDAMEAAPARAA